VLGDFGSQFDLNRLTQSFGTAAHMGYFPPELTMQSSARIDLLQLTEKVDLYQMGKQIQEMVYGRVKDEAVSKEDHFLLQFVHENPQLRLTTSEALELPQLRVR